MARKIIVPIGPSIAYVPLPGGLYSLIDATMAPNIGSSSWYARPDESTGNFYAYNTTRGSLSRLICGTPKGLQCDHSNRNTLDNRIANLRTATSSQNSINRRKRITNTSGHIGISWNKASRKWEANIRIERRQIRLGYFLLLSEAIEARRLAVIAHYGSFAPQNGASF